MKQLEVTIMGQSYVLACPDGGEPSLQAAVQRVDEEMAAIRAAGKVKARERIAVLAALNLAYAGSGSSPVASTPAGDEARAPAQAEPAAPVERETERQGELAPELESLLRRIDEQLGELPRTE